MKCPDCEAGETRVINSRPAGGGSAVRRRRECLACGHRFTTLEEAEKSRLIVVKRDQTREEFTPSKVRSSIEKACHKRRVTAEQIDGIAEAIEQQLENGAGREVEATEIGRLILRHLKEIDKVAYLRFASVYKEFRDLQDFNKEIETLLKD
ncbi:transcriptional repressor NrdR [Candidatus Poribacteria bacterium]|nr:transcriptional repressor NrdR [Candidatus Poribacteria bacterium]